MPKALAVTVAVTGSTFTWTSQLCPTSETLGAMKQAPPSSKVAGIYDFGYMFVNIKFDENRSSKQKKQGPCSDSHTFKTASRTNPPFAAWVKRNGRIHLHFYLVNSRYAGVTNNVKYLKFVLHTEPIIITQ